MKEQIEKVLSSKNWTGHTLRELASYGRVGPNENTIAEWVRGALGSISFEELKSNPKAISDRQRVEAYVAMAVERLNNGPSIFETETL